MSHCISFGPEEKFFTDLNMRSEAIPYAFNFGV
jgi:hypothetical protein